MTLIRLNYPLVDYLTLTSYSRSWLDFMIESFAPNRATWFDMKRNGYVGKMYDLGTGSLSILTGNAKGKPHYLMSISGEVADSAIVHVLERSKGYKVKCRRLDVQVTVMMPKNMSMVALRNRLEKDGRTVGYPSPSRVDGTKMETVYIGKRTKSDRFYRVYMKLLDTSDFAVRFEAELKKRRSVAIWKDWEVSGLSRDSIVSELRLLGSMDRMIMKQLSCLDMMDGRAIRVRTQESQTERWLINDVMPVLKRFLCNHESDSGAVLSAVYDVLESYEISAREARDRLGGSAVY